MSFRYVTLVARGPRLLQTHIFKVMAITHITSLSQLDAVLKKSPTKLTVSRNCALAWHGTHLVPTYLTGHRLPRYVVGVVTF